MKNILYLISFVFFLGFGVGSDKYAPDNAFVYINNNTKTFICPPSVPVPPPRYLKLTTKEKAKKAGYSLDEQSQNNGDLFQEDRSLSGILLEKIGILSPLPSRWNENGTWNW